MKVAIAGMHCDACVRRVRIALEKVPGVAVQDVNVGSATVSADPSQESAVLDAIRAAGYEPRANA
jgi:copper chaperone CopZ